MLLLIAFAFLAGAGTALSPCVLPVLPVVLAGGVTGGARRPLGIATGLVLSFTFATVALIYALDALGLPDDFARNMAIVALAGFGVVLLVPALSDRVEGLLARLAPRAPAGAGEGFGSGLFLGISLGFVYAPCAGPILAAVATASAAQPFTLDKLLVAFAYGAGSGLVIYALALGGRRVAGWLRPFQSRVNMAMGALLIAFAALLVADLDLEFQQALAEDAPAILRNPTEGLEQIDSLSADLAELRGGRAREEGGVEEAAAGLALPHLGRAPELTATQRWFNSEPLSISGLRGRVVLIDFWTYTCINCIRTLPHLRAWWERYRDEGLVVVGVHTPEFPFERRAENLDAAIEEYELGYPVVQDNEYGTWSAYANQYWPAKYLIDASGEVRFVHFGEGSYEETEGAIRSLLAERGARRLGGPTRVTAKAAAPGVTTPEIYLGALRAERFVNRPLLPGRRVFARPRDALPPDHLALSGVWRIGGQSATSIRGAELDLEFGARRVFLVLGSAAGRRQVGVLLDGRPIAARLAGVDVRAGRLTVGEQRLYHLVELKRVERHVLTLRFDPGVSGYAFTFG
jgi:cytochrome c biogenesis protein CcdA/thiol-disulfide isomerase/thioredoxin